MATLYLGHMCPAQSYIWLPLVIYFLSRAVSAKTYFRGSLVAGIIWGIQILAGAPQDAFYTFLASMLFLVCSSKLGRRDPASTPKLSAIALFFFLTGAGIASIQIIPAFEFIGESVRTSLNTYELVTQASYPPAGLITAILPNFFGNYAKGGFWVGNVPWSLPHQNLYVGILPLISLLFLSFRRSEQRHVILFAGIVAVMAVLLALGRNTPVYRLAYLFPGFDKFRTPTRIISLWVFAMGLLGGKGFDALIHSVRNQLSKRLIFLTSIGVGLLVLDIILHYQRLLVLRVFSPFVLHDAIPGRMGYATDVILGEYHRFTLIALCALLCLLLMRRGFMLSFPGTVSLCLLLLVDLGMASSSGIRRDVAFYPWIQEIKKGLDSSIGRDKTVYRVGSYSFGLGPNLEMLLGYQTVGGFTALFPTRYYEYINRYANGELPEGWQSFHYGESKNHLLMDLLNVKYAISHTAATYKERKSYLPRAFMVYGYKSIKKDEILDRLTNPDFDPVKEILFEREQDPLQPFQNPSRSSLPVGQVEIVSYRPDSLTVQTKSSEAGFLFLSEVFYPGWKAFIDGQPTRILRGDYLFRILEVPQGEHQVRLVFDPWTIKAGTGITVLTALLILAVPAFRRLKRKVPHS